MGKRKNKNMPQKKDNTIYYLVAGLVLIVGLIIFATTRSNTGNFTTEDGEFDEFAQCLTEQGAIFYGTEWCGYCQQQKEMLGSSMQHINFVDCDENRNTCMSEGVTGYPTWKINGQLYSGMQQLPRLSELSGCEIFPETQL
ncbi:MAG: protein disulfide isomerase family protein [Candidatus Woesearchaeota archaeon]